MRHIFVHAGLLLMICFRFVFCDASDADDELVFVHIVSTFSFNNLILTVLINKFAL